MRLCFVRFVNNTLSSIKRAEMIDFIFFNVQKVGNILYNVYVHDD